MSIARLFVKSPNSNSELRLDSQQTIEQLKFRLEPVVGIPAADQGIALYNGQDLVAKLNNDAATLGSYPVQDYWTLQVSNLNPNSSAAIDFNDLSSVEKYEMSEAEYSKRIVLAFKKRNKMGRFSDEAQAKMTRENDPDAYRELAETIKVNDRCEVDLHGTGIMKRRGTVRFVGKTKFKPGYWVGVEYDEPYGKHNGCVDGIQYFTCPESHGSFVRPDRLT
ncbi:hypothetical protein EV182_005770, partial [Spiromyces aspiralis]